MQIIWPQQWQSNPLTEIERPSAPRATCRSTSRRKLGACANGLKDQRVFISPRSLGRARVPSSKPALLWEITMFQMIMMKTYTVFPGWQHLAVLNCQVEGFFLSICVASNASIRTKHGFQASTKSDAARKKTLHNFEFLRPKWVCGNLRCIRPIFNQSYHIPMMIGCFLPTLLVLVRQWFSYHSYVGWSN